MRKQVPERIRKPEEALYHLVEVLDVLRLGVESYNSGRKSAWMIISAYLHQLLVDKSKGHKPLAARVIPSLKLHPMRINISSSKWLMYSPVKIMGSRLEVFDLSKPRIPLDSWLKQVAYIQVQNQQGIQITLEELIKTPRHKAGGVHFDEKLDNKMQLIEGVLAFVQLGPDHLSFRDYIVAIGDYIHTEINCDLMGCLANGYISQGNYSKGKEFLITAIDISKNANNLHLLCEHLANLGRLHYKIQELSESEQCYLKALSICQSINDREMEHECQRSLAIIYLALGNQQSEANNNESAINYYKKAIDRSHIAGDMAHEIIILSNLGIIYRKIGALRSAIATWLAPLLLDLDLDKLDSSDAGPIRPIIGKIIYNLSAIRKDTPDFDATVREVLTNWEQMIREATDQPYPEVNHLDTETVFREIASLLGEPQK